MKAKKATKVLGRLSDRLEHAICAAHGLSALVCGLECMNEHDNDGAWALVELHIESLRAISADLAATLRK